MLFNSSVLKENLEGHIKRCPFLKRVQSLTMQPFYQKGINSGIEEEDPEEDRTMRPPKVENLALPNANQDSRFLDQVTSESKRNAVYSMSIAEFCKLIEKIESVHRSIYKDIRDSYKIPEACGIWIQREVDGYI